MTRPSHPPTPMFIPGYVRFDAGEPVIDDHIPRDVIETDGRPYMKRYYLHHSPAMSIRLHHLLTSDPGRDLHDHPWDFCSLLLTGGYRETTPDGETDYRSPCVVSRRAEQFHRLDLLDGPMWTYVVTGPVRRRWGFMTEGGWVHWREYDGAGSYA